MVNSEFKKRLTSLRGENVTFANLRKYNVEYGLHEYLGCYCTFRNRKEGLVG